VLQVKVFWNLAHWWSGVVTPHWVICNKACKLPDYCTVNSTSMQILHSYNDW